MIETMKHEEADTAHNETDHHETVLEAPGEVVNPVKKRSPVKTAASVVGNAAFIVSMLLLVFLVFSMVQSKRSGGPPSIAGHQMYIVAGGSMSPTFEVGSLAILEYVEPQQIKAGDVLTYRSESSEGVTTHRVMKVHEANGEFSFTTRGDANEIDDGYPVQAPNVIGRVIWTIPYLGLLMDFAQSKTGLLTLIIIPGVLLIIFETRNLLKYAAEAE